MNGYSIDIRDKELVAVIDRAGIAAANFNEVRGVIKRLAGMSKSERAAWEKKIKRIIESNREFLIYIGSEDRSEAFQA